MRSPFLQLLLFHARKKKKGKKIWGVGWKKRGRRGRQDCPPLPAGTEKKEKKERKREVAYFKGRKGEREKEEACWRCLIF